MNKNHKNYNYYKNVKLNPYNYFFKNSIPKTMLLID